jgi:hypothetical protein
MEEYIPEGATYVIEGPQRRGKTLAGVILAYDAWRQGREVFSTIQLAFPHRPLEFGELQLEDGNRKFWNGHIFIDELNFFFDCRKSLAKGNLEFGYYMLQQKKQGCNLTGTTHSLDYLDLRMRAEYDYLIIPRVSPRFPHRPEVLYLHIVNGPSQPPCSKRLKIPVAPFLGMYDTFAVYDPFEKGKPEKKKQNQKKPVAPQESRVKF